MATWTYYQLTAIDGTDKPLAYFRYDGKTPQFWTGSDWSPSVTLLDKLTTGDPMLDELDADPTITKASGDDMATIFFLTPTDTDASNPSGTIVISKGQIVHTDGCAQPFLNTAKAQGADDQTAFNHLANNWTNGFYYTVVSPAR
jgi:hypothetical protein